jgi:hypothetical protein
MDSGLDGTPGTARSLVAPAFGALLLLLGLFCLAGGWIVYVRDSSLEARGGRAQAVVGRKEARTTSFGTSDLSVEYSFPLQDGRRITAMRALKKERWDRLKVGDVLDVRYDPENPATNFPSGEGRSSLALPLLASAVAAIFTFSGFALLSVDLRAR